MLPTFTWTIYSAGIIKSISWVLRCSQSTPEKKRLKFPVHLLYRKVLPYICAKHFSFSWYSLRFTKLKADDFYHTDEIARRDVLTMRVSFLSRREPGPFNHADNAITARRQYALNAVVVSLIRRRLRPLIIPARVHYASTRGRKRNGIARTTKLNRNFRPLSGAEGETKRGLIVVASAGKRAE